MTDKPLPNEFLGTKLGQLKIENFIKKGSFIAPKVYGILDVDNKNIVKIKGLKNNLFYYELNFVLYKETVIEKTQGKWHRNWKNGNIKIKKEIYSLMITGNKRQLIFGFFSKLVATKPYIYINGVIINNYYDYTLNIAEPNFKEKLIVSPFNPSNIIN